MKQEIRQNNITILHSEDGCSIPVIFNNLTGKNFKGKEYSDYIRYVAIPDMGFTYGKIEYYSDGHYKIFCVNGKYGIQVEFRIFYFIALQNEEDYERKESSSA